VTLGQDKKKWAEVVIDQERIMLMLRTDVSLDITRDLTGCPRTKDIFPDVQVTHTIYTGSRLGATQPWIVLSMEIHPNMLETAYYGQGMLMMMMMLNLKESGTRWTAERSTSK